MSTHDGEKRKVLPAGDRQVIHVLNGRGEGLRLPLASHRIRSPVGPAAETLCKRLEVESDVDPVVLANRRGSVGATTSLAPRRKGSGHVPGTLRAEARLPGWGGRFGERVASGLHHTGARLRQRVPWHEALKRLPHGAGRGSFREPS
jgi:hypothetical protein